MSSTADRLKELSKTIHFQENWGGPEARDELLAIARRLLQERNEARQPINNQHKDPKECPTWYDGCNCNVETLTHNIDRAQKAEAEIGRLRRKIRAFADNIADSDIWACMYAEELRALAEPNRADQHDKGGPK